MTYIHQMEKVKCPGCRKEVRPKRRGPSIWRTNKFYCPKCRYNMDDLVLGIDIVDWDSCFICGATIRKEDLAYEDSITCPHCGEHRYMNFEETMFHKYGEEAIEF